MYESILVINILLTLHALHSIKKTNRLIKEVQDNLELSIKNPLMARRLLIKNKN